MFWELQTSDHFHRSCLWRAVAREGARVGGDGGGGGGDGRQMMPAC